MKIIMPEFEEFNFSAPVDNEELDNYIGRINENIYGGITNVSIYVPKPFRGKITCDPILEEDNQWIVFGYISPTLCYDDIVVKSDDIRVGTVEDFVKAYNAVMSQIKDRYADFIDTFLVWE